MGDFLHECFNCGWMWLSTIRNGYHVCPCGNAANETHEDPLLIAAFRIGGTKAVWDILRVPYDDDFDV